MSLRIIISGGGTGGHIFPAIAIANALKAKLPDTEILFVGAEGRMEMEKVPAAGYKIVGLWISGFQRKLSMKNFLVPFKIIASMLKASRIIKEFKPDAVVGVGGYASGPMLQTAVRKKIPTLIQEQNSFPGITNKILAKKVDKICVAYNGMEKYFPKEKLIITGNPVRQDITDLQQKKSEACIFFGISPERKTLLVIGGSLGALTINESIAGCLKLLAENNIQIVWQTGKSYYETAQQIVNSSPNGGGWTGAFITRMDFAYSIADMVVSRAGAISVSELCIAGKAAILVPSPNVAEDHQTKNAMALVNQNAALLVKDSEARAVLGKKIMELMNDAMLRNSLEKNISRFAKKDSASVIADEVIALAEKKNG